MYQISGRENCTLGSFLGSGLSFGGWGFQRLQFLKTTVVNIQSIKHNSGQMAKLQISKQDD